MINASGKPLGFFCSEYFILIPRLFFSGKILRNLSICPLFTIIKIFLILSSLTKIMGKKLRVYHKPVATVY